MEFEFDLQFTFTKEEEGSGLRKLVELELNQQTDRGVAIVGAAIIYERLSRLMMNRLVGDSKIINAVFEGPLAPLQSLSNKTNMAYVTGAIDKRSRDEIQRLRKIRNTFAHSLREEPNATNRLTFDSPSISTECRKLIVCSRFDILADYGGTRTAIVGSAGYAGKPRNLFIATVYTMLEYLRLVEEEEDGGRITIVPVRRRRTPAGKT